MHVGQYRHANLLLDLFQDTQPLLQSGAAITLAGTAIGLVERGLVDERDGQFISGFLQGAGAVQGQLFAFDDARAGDQEQRVFGAGIKTAQIHVQAPFR